ncbi:MAG: hypothetical protein AAB875_01850 [Patescibacteria group bacterium]
MIVWKNRIIGHGTEKPEKLLSNPKNWRLHPKIQREPLHAVLETLGWIQDIIVNIRDNDQWSSADRNIHTVVDGHLRIALAIQNDQPDVPVKYVNLLPEEEALALTTLDPLAALAHTDKEKLDVLLRELPETIDIRLQEMIADLTKKEGLYAGNDIKTTDEECQTEEEDTKTYFCPKCGFEFATK